MGQPFFEFKQFRIAQEACGMKVTTDACIQGAWTPVPQGTIRVLDVGTGTGLLSLMIAQRAPDALIDGLEIEEGAAAQALANCAASPFGHQVTIFHLDARNWSSTAQYDLLICNPPFFSNSLTSPEYTRNLARHDDSLRQADLIALFDRFLQPEGIASIMLPVSELVHFDQQASKAGWSASLSLEVRDRADARIKRMIRIYRRGSHAPISKELIIKQIDGSYTAEFGALMAPYYLHL